MKTRTYGWIQNPSDFDKLRKTVEIFDSSTDHYKKLRDKVIKQEIIYFEDIRDSLQNKFDNDIECFTYNELAGTSMDKNRKRPKKRADAEANALIQISLIPQQYKRTGRKYSDDWTSDGFLRWAVSLNLVEVNRIKDTFCISDRGREYLETKPNSLEETEFLRDVFLRYPPATRVLEVLSSDDSKKYYSKFEIGENLGFRGEPGFTSYEHEIMQEWIESAATKEEVKKIRRDVEGTSDKYARMICRWLEKVGFVSVLPRTSFKEFQMYSITANGLHALKQSKGNSNNPQKEKFIMWEFLGVKGIGREYRRMRRAKILKFLEKSRSYKSLLEYMKDQGYSDDEKTILSDIKGLNNTGIRITVQGNKITLLDKLNDFSLPNISVNLTEKEKENLAQKEKLLKYIDYDEKYLELLDIARDGKRNRDFEILTTSLFKNVYKVSSEHLGGGRKPDGVIYTSDYGVIFDTKAYQKGYGKNIDEADKMVRYIQENKKRNSKINENKWWEVFPEEIPEEDFYFLWISSEFLNGFEEQIKETYHRTKVKGAALNVEQLLVGANKFYKKTINIKDLSKYLNNDEIIFERI